LREKQLPATRINRLSRNLFAEEIASSIAGKNPIAFLRDIPKMSVQAIMKQTALILILGFFIASPLLADGMLAV